MVSDQGGFDDQSFNQTSYAGLERAEKELGVQIATVESSSPADFDPNVDSLINQQNCNLVIGVGFARNGLGFFKLFWPTSAPLVLRPVVGAIEFLHKRIVTERDKGTAVLIVSTELDEIEALADRIAVMYRGRIVGIVPAGTPREVLGLMMAGFSHEEATESTGASIPDPATDRTVLESVAPQEPDTATSEEPNR